VRNVEGPARLSGEACFTPSIAQGCGVWRNSQPRLLSFKGTLQTMTAFQDDLRRARPIERQHFIEEMIKAIASHGVGDRYGRIEPRANKRRPKP
jgi:hypothetical protein